MRRLQFSSPYGVTTVITPSAFVTYVIVAPLLGWLASALLDLTFGPAALAGAISAFLLYPSEWLHQMGHARAAYRVGYPMSKIWMFSPLALSLYPRDEPELPRAIHVKRALGGFWVNLLVGVLLAPLAVALWPRGDVWAWVVGFIAAHNFFILGIGPFVPIPFPGGNTTDGGTLLRLWREKRAEARETGDQAT